MNLGKAIRKPRTLASTKVQEHIQELNQPPRTVQVPARDARILLNGGWVDGASDDQVHYMRITATNDNGELELQSLCGTVEGTGTRNELTDCDPLAVENCKLCRTVLLAQRRLI